MNNDMKSTQELRQMVRSAMNSAELGTQIREHAKITFPGTPAVTKDGSVWFKRGEYIGVVDGVRWLLVSPPDVRGDSEIEQWQIRGDRDGHPMLEPFI